MFSAQSISNFIREPAVAGFFYPADRRRLESDIKSLLARAAPQPTAGSIIALISPHAGYQFSGLTAAHAYKLLKARQFDSVVVVSPSHREYFNGISVFNGQAYRTPIGMLSVDRDLREKLLEGETDILASMNGHRDEHAIEVQLPFVRETLGDVTILPIVMGDQRRAYCSLLGQKLGRILKGTSSLLIASTDLSHYHSYDEALVLDKTIIDAVNKLDHEKLMNDLESERVEACGGGPTVAVLIGAKILGADSVNILHRCNSGDVTGDRTRVVGYLSAVALRST